MTTTRLGVALVAVATAFVAVGCASQSQGGASSSGVAPTQSSASGGKDLSGPLTYAIWDANQKPAMQQIADAFTKLHPKVSITIEVTPGKQYFPKRQTEATSNTLPDVWWINGSRFGLYASQGKLMSLQGLVDSHQIDPSNYPDSLVAPAMWKGELYGAPKDYDTIGVFYNKAIFDKAGVQYPSKGWNWAEFQSDAIKISQALKSDGIYGNVTDLSDGQGGYYNTIKQAGGYILSEDKSKLGFDDPKSMKGLQFWVDLIAKGGEPTLQEIADTSDDQRFISGKAAMWWTGSWSAAQVNDSPVAKDVSVAPLPKGEVAASVMSGISNVVSTNTKNKDAALAFVAYLGGKDAALVQAKTGTVIPAFNGTQDAWVDAYPSSMNVQAFVDQVADGSAFPYPTSLDSGAWQTIEREMLPDVFDGKADLDSVAKDLTQKGDEALSSEG